MIKLNLKFSRITFRRSITRVTRPLIKKFLDDVADRMRALMRGPKSGRNYGLYRASAPGEAPGVRTGTLIRSIGRPAVSDLRGTLRVTAPYAAFLEKGTNKMAARPFAEVAAKGVADEMRRSFGGRGRI